MAAFVLSVTLTSILPRTGKAALSISSGYETFLTQIRNRIVCAEDDVFDEAAQHAWAQPCDSMKDGPFCRGLPEMGETARHRPFTLDSIVPQHLFGDPRATMELAASNAVKSSVDADTSANKQATLVLNKFLEDFSKVKEVYVKSVGVEGRLDFSRLPMGGSLGFSRSFSLGLPSGVSATWTGPWQVIPAEQPPPDTLQTPKRRAALKFRPRAVLRLNGALGSIRFSRPVVVRSLQIQGGSRLWVRGRQSGGEVWRHSYQSELQICGTGDLVLGRWEGDGQLYYARILMPHEAGATLWWIDRDPSHRLVSWEHLTTPAGRPCLGDAPGPGDPGRGLRKSAWRDLARRSKAVDEISFMVPDRGSTGWLLGELHVATIRWRPEVDEETVRLPSDALSRVVQVLPGPFATIEDVSHAALYYNADDMLEQGLRLNSFARRQELLEQATRKSQKGDSYVQLNAFRSVEGLKQMLRALMPGLSRSFLQLPAPITHARVLADLDHLVTTLDVSHLQPEDQEKVVKRYGHFEVFFADIWDWRTAIDSLQLLYELWREDPVMQKEVEGVFKQGTSWQGSYFCTQGRTQFSLDITEVTSVGGKDQIRADLTFTIVKKDKNVTGIYEVLGILEPAGRSLVMEPIPDSWKAQPKNFVMVGTHGVVSAVDGTDRAVYAGTVPIYGCDSFELFSEGTSSTDQREEYNLPWNGALKRLSEAIDSNRHLWRSVLQSLIAEKPSKPNKVVQLFEAARNAGLLSVEFTTNGGEEVVLQLQSKR